MASMTEKLYFKFYLILINLNSYMKLVVTVLDSIVLKRWGLVFMVLAALLLAILQVSLLSRLWGKTYLATVFCLLESSLCCKSQIYLFSFRKVDLYMEKSTLWCVGKFDFLFQLTVWALWEHSTKCCFLKMPSWGKSNIWPHIPMESN